ncbi:uncharacterized protein LOC130123747 [Lampris incognitus]|uniref:uncharacterized protein LOC130123747 n=1 Tax=Lampris incognitus TaxID=2546036 RepID=UPI0024B4A5CA|nr:uncharacterized protein LOC130123747 [Lampris incognitus]
MLFVDRKQLSARVDEKMNYPNKAPFNNPGAPKGAISAYQNQTGRVTQGFNESAPSFTPMKANTESSNQPSVTPNRQFTAPAARRTSSIAFKWKSSVTSSGDSCLSQDGNSQDRKSSFTEKFELYDPYDPGSSDSESEIPQRQGGTRCRSSENYFGHSGRKRSSSDIGPQDSHHWESAYSGSGNISHEVPHEGWDLGCDTRHPKRPSPRDRLAERETYSTDTKSSETSSYGFISRPPDQKGFESQALPDSVMSVLFPASSYRGQRTNVEERITAPEPRREMTTTAKLSPGFQVGYNSQSGYSGTGVDQITPSSEVSRTWNISPKSKMEKSPFICELCDVELAKMRDLDDHLESKSHWETLEHIQQHYNYNDLTIAFLQEVMYKFRQCSKAMEESAIEALQEKDYMTKVEMLHCAACKVLVSTSVSSVQNHLNSQEHLQNKKEYGIQKRSLCLDKTEAMMKELKPQFEKFLKGVDPFE